MISCWLFNLFLFECLYCENTLCREISHSAKIELSGKSQSLSLISLISGQKAGRLVSLIFLFSL